MRKLAVIGALALLSSLTWAEADRAKELERIDNASKVMDEIMATPDKGIPSEILKSAECVAVVPSMKKGGFVFGARYGKGVATCHTAKGWSAPAPLVIEGGSWGMQIGGQAVDLVMLIMNEEGMRNLLESKFKIGADASAAAGPVGRDVEGSTDWKMRAQVLTYSRARGAFAGITLNGAVIKQDEDDTRALYGRVIPFKTILTGGVPPPQGSQVFISTVRKYFRAAQEQATSSETPSSRTAGGATGTAAGTERSPKSTETSGSVAGGTQSSTSSARGTTSETKSSESQAASSSDVRTDIQNALRNEPGLSSSNVDVKVTDDSVILSGSVPNQSDKATIRRIVKSKAGNRSVVDDQLLVK